MLTMAGGSDAVSKKEFETSFGTNLARFSKATHSIRPESPNKSHTWVHHITECYPCKDMMEDGPVDKGAQD